MSLFERLLKNSKDANNSSQSTSDIPSPAKTLAFLNQKGGVGKTTIAFQTAYALKEFGLKVLCLDLDPQANLSYLFGAKQSPYNLFHLLLNSVKELKAMHTPLSIGDLLQTRHGVDFIPAGSELSGLDLAFSAVTVPRQLILKRFLENSGLMQSYDAILFDSPPTLGLMVVNIICASEALLIPFKADQFSRQGIEHLHQVLLDIAEMELVPGPRALFYLPNLVDVRRKIEEKDLLQIEEEVKKTDGILFAPFANKLPLLKCQHLGKSVFEMRGQEFQVLASDFLTIGRKIVEVLDGSSN